MDTETYLEQRPRLFAVAYRMLGSATEAEDILQEAYLRWQAQPADTVESPASYLTTVVVRICVDQLRSARVRRETYVGPWLPEPLLVDENDPSDAVELADSLSMAFLVLLEALSPAERAAFLLHDVFAYEYAEIAAMLDRREPACRQLVTRARHRVGERRQRFDADRAQGQELARQFTAACITGDLETLLSLLADDAVVWTDGGGRAKAAPRPIYGARKAARFLIGIARDVPAGVDTHEVVLNGQPGLLLTDAGVVTSALAFDVVDGRITGVRLVANPDKLRALQPADH